VYCEDSSTVQHTHCTDRKRCATGKPAEALTPTRRELHTLNALFGMTSESARQVVSVATQVNSCGGLKRLTALLTSPTAAINVAHSKTADSANSSSNSGGMGTHLRGTTSNIQGMCTKQASRALIALLCPDMPIPLPLPAPVPLPVSPAVESLHGISRPTIPNECATYSSMETETATQSTLTDAPGNVQSSEKSSDVTTASIWRRDTQRSAELTSPNRIQLQPLVPTPPRGARTHNHSDSTTSKVQDIRTQRIQCSSGDSNPNCEAANIHGDSSGSGAATAVPVVPEHLRSPPVSTLFLTDPSPQPWQFTYFYKSGALKDQFTSYLLFSPTGGLLNGTVSTSGGVSLRGRGVDSTGTFTLSGRAEAEISGWSWYFHKSYVSTDAGGVAIPAPDAHFETTAEDGANAALERWLQDVDGNNDAVVMSIRSAPVHVSHVAYWSGGVENGRRSRVMGSGLMDRDCSDDEIGGLWYGAVVLVAFPAGFFSLPSVRESFLLSLTPWHQLTSLCYLGVIPHIAGVAGLFYPST
jgi:hypothetical protein